MKPDFKSTINGTATKDHGTILDRLEDAISRAGVSVRVDKTEAGMIDIDAKDYSDWVIARSITVNEFAFAKEVVRWTKH